jgi:hypothetical protein
MAAELDIHLPRKSPLDVKTELSEIDSSIATMVVQILELMQRRRLLEKLGSKDNGPPISKLPVELWEKIFLDCLPEEGEARPCPREAPLILTQICGGWRNIALSSPRLWSTLAIKTSARHERKQDEEKFKNIVQMWLSRSAACPLSISLTSGTLFQSYRTPSSRLVPIWDALAPHIGHWKSLDLNVPESSLSTLFTSPPRHLPLLESLKLDVFPEMQSWQATSFTLESAPRLKRVFFAHVTFDIRSLNINYAQLTEMTVLPQAWAKAEMFLTIEECLEILAVAQNLTKCMLCIEDVMPTRSASIVSPVKEFHISFRDSDRRANLRGVQPHRSIRLGQFFELSTMPMLQTLTVGNFVGNFTDSGTWPNNSFVTFLAQSACPLQSIRLAFLPILESELISLLRLTPDLTHLVVEARQGVGAQLSVGDDLLRALAICPLSSCDHCLAPCLESIDFRYCGKRCTERAILDMIESRQPSEGEQVVRHGTRVSQLKSFSIQMSHRPGEDLSSKVGNWSSRGLEVEISVGIMTFSGPHQY